MGADLDIAAADLACDNGSADASAAKRIVAEYDYVDEGGALLYQVLRYEPKDFRQRRPDGEGGWEWRLGDVRRVLYRLPEVVDAVALGEMIYVVEGEKDVATLEGLGLIATTSCGGASPREWRKPYAESLRAAHVVIVPDNDEAGRAHASAVAAALKGQAADVRIVNLRNLPDKGDVSDWVAAGGTCEEFTELVQGTRVELPGIQRPSYFVDWRTIWDPNGIVEDWLVDGILPRGRGVSLYAEHKLGKSLFMLCLAAKLATSDDAVVVVYLDYEMTQADLVERLADMGYGPETDFSRLFYALLPSLAPLDTGAGGQELIALLDGIQAEWPDHHLALIIDTFGRAVTGEENAADTVRSFYECTGVLLKRGGISWCRLDHAGKGKAKGPRGSSGKGDDVDLVWKLTATENGIRLKNEASRIVWAPESVTFKTADSPLSYVRLADDWPAGTASLAVILDRLKLPLDVKVRDAQSALREIDEGRRQELIRAALRWRRERQRETP